MKDFSKLDAVVKLKRARAKQEDLNRLLNERAPQTYYQPMQPIYTHMWMYKKFADINIEYANYELFANKDDHIKHVHGVWK